MSRNQPSKLTAPTSNKRVAEDPLEGNATHPAGVLKQPIATGTNPTDAALKTMNEFIATLHPTLRRLVEDEVRPLLCALIEAERKRTSANKMLKDNAPIPSSVLRLLRKWKVKAPNEVKERQEFKTLSEESAAILERCQNDLARIVGRASKLTADYLQEIAVEMYCRFLLFLVDNAMVQLCIEGYPDVVAAVDLIHDKTDHILNITKLTLDKFLPLFKQHNGLATLPRPTIPVPRRDFVLLVDKLNQESTTQEGDDQDAKNDEDADMESLASSPLNTGGRVVMVNKTMELLAGLLWEPWAKYCEENTAKNKSNRLLAYVEKARKKKNERNKIKTT